MAAPPGDRVALTLVAFPGFTIRYSSRTSASASASSWSLTGARDNEDVEEIRIPMAETYGVSPPSAVERLQDWCSREELRRRCTEEFARKILQFAFGERALAAAGGVQPHVELMLITRAYLMREIDQRRASTSNRNAGATAPLDVVGPAAAPIGSASIDRSVSTTTASTTANTDGAPTHAAAARAATGAGTAVSRMVSTEIALRQSFERPLVFGYRSVSIVPP